ncbi:hypothetical protein EVAR_101815_1 [Eumeta japonica]|uniref:Uncharacterized protein n=1 Tax=Eumeta variegata TaxID=151549 RepID=A0A4C1SMN1_EUMVA|nr:hypothetical protein EVAR_101815_1 [Eumeta japonica]
MTFVPYTVILVLQALHVSIIPCLPAFIVESIASETDKIKLLLLDKVIDSKSEEEKKDIHLFLYYLEMRPFKYRIWRTIAVDVGLPLGLISFYTTYIIAIVQFSHLYDIAWLASANVSNTLLVPQKHTLRQYNALNSAAINCLRMMQCAGSILFDPSSFFPPSCLTPLRCFRD